MNIELLQNNYAVSCVENYLVATCKSLNLPYEITYTNAFVDHFKVFSDFLVGQEHYAYYKGLPRLQHTAEELGFVSLQYKEIDEEGLTDAINEQLHNGLPIMLEIDSRKLPSLNGVLPHREDHFILLYNKVGNDFQFLDDSPLRNEQLPLTSLIHAYRGHILNIVLNKSFLLSNYLSHSEHYLTSLEINAESQQRNFQPWGELTIQNVSHFRDAIGILRNSRKRIAAWLTWLDMNCIEKSNMFESTIKSITESARMLDRLYNSAEMARVRKQQDFSNLLSLANQYLLQEQAWIDTFVQARRQASWK